MATDRLRLAEDRMCARENREAEARNPGAEHVLLVVPNRLRDLHGHALLGHHLERTFGHRVTYADSADANRSLESERPDLIVLDQLTWDYRVRTAVRAKELGARVVILPNSGLFQRADMQRHAELAGVRFGANRLVDGFLAWGERVRRFLDAEDVIPAERIHTTGSPRFDFYVPPLIGLARSRQEVLASLGFEDRHAPLILWTPSNTRYGCLNRGSLDRWARGARLTAVDMQGEIEDVLTQYQEHSRLLVALARLRPRWNFLVKVHPSDRLDTFEWMLGEASNIRLVLEVPVLEVLHHADILLQRYSTTANEAWLLGRPVVLLDAGRYNIPLDDEFRRGCDPATTLEETEFLIEQRLSGIPIPTEQEEARRTFILDNYHLVDGRSAERCASVIHDLFATPVMVPEIDPLDVLKHLDSGNAGLTGTRTFEPSRIRTLLQRFLSRLRHPWQSGNGQSKASADSADQGAPILDEIRKVQGIVSAQGDPADRRESTCPSPS